MTDVYVVSAFSKNNKGGNKAGVVLDTENLTSGQKLKIAKELGYSETAFVSPSDVADLKLEYFTPTEEVPLCGHATIATFVLLNSLNMIHKPNYIIETNAGILRIYIEDDGMISMEQNIPTYFDILEPSLFINCLTSEYIDNSLPIQIVSTGLKDILIPIHSIEELENLNVNHDMISNLCKEKGVVGIHAFTLTDKSDVTAICRNFAPLYGINEESATGTSNCALACYLFKYYDKKKQYIFEQGYNLGNISRLIVTITSHNDIIDSVLVGGYGYIVCKKHLIYKCL